MQQKGLLVLIILSCATGTILDTLVQLLDTHKQSYATHPSVFQPHKHNGTVFDFILPENNTITI